MTKPGPQPRPFRFQSLFPFFCSPQQSVCPSARGALCWLLHLPREPAALRGSCGHGRVGRAWRSVSEGASGQLCRGTGQEGPAHAGQLRGWRGGEGPTTSSPGGDCPSPQGAEGQCGLQGQGPSLCTAPPCPGQHGPSSWGSSGMGQVSSPLHPAIPRVLSESARAGTLAPPAQDFVTKSCHASVSPSVIIISHSIVVRIK